MKLPKGLAEEIEAMIGNSVSRAWSKDEIAFMDKYAVPIREEGKGHRLFIKIYKKAFPGSKRSDAAISRKFYQTGLS